MGYGETMIVTCRAIKNSVTREWESESSWVRIGDEYLVVGVLSSPARGVELQIIDRSGTPSLWSAEMFTTRDERIPSCWIARLEEKGSLHFGPARWQTPGFWESYFDRDEAAEALYEEVLAEMLAELG